MSWQLARLTGLWFARTLADFEINDIAGGLVPEFCYNSDYAQRARVRVPEAEGERS
jgi:hypothetical protein